MRFNANLAAGVQAHNMESGVIFVVDGLPF